MGLFAQAQVYRRSRRGRIARPANRNRKSTEFTDGKAQ